MHLSIRVPWHDTAWTGLVCAAPSLNEACLALPRIHEERNDAAEDARAGADWQDLAPQALPPCMRERAGFMRPGEFAMELTHPYTGGGSRAHAGLLPLQQRIPGSSAPCVPFRWMRREYAADVAQLHGIDFRPQLEDEADQLIGFDSQWVQHGRNQRAMLEGFFSAIQESSLCFFYAKRIPLVEDDRRVIIGVGRALTVGLPERYGGDNPLDTVAWECMVQHSIRPEFHDGFLMPYHDALRVSEEDPDFDPATVVAFAPEDAWMDFSYGCEHVSHDAAISALVACESALRVAAGRLPGSRERELSWLSDRLGELWKLRGPCPGLGAALEAFGVSQGTLVVRTLAPLIPENGDPWELIGRAMEDPHMVLPGLQRHFTSSLRAKWRGLPGERRALLQLLSRFALTPEQANRWYQPTARQDAGIALADDEILANPYLLYEADRRTRDSISVITIDHGVFPDEVVREVHPLAEPSALEDGLDVRRARALLVRKLEVGAERGHTLLRASDLIRGVRELPLDPPCPIDEDMLAVYGDDLGSVLRHLTLKHGVEAFQLVEIDALGKVIRGFVDRRLAGARHEGDARWRRLLDDELGDAEPGDPDEPRAREEKTKALEELFAARFSVLVGPAGTGKTTLLKVLCNEPSVAAGGILLLAPTGKARVRLKQTLGRDAQTLAQFLLPSGRYVIDTSEYRTIDFPASDAHRTVIIDEASMLTEAQLAAAIDGVRGVARFILVGDFRQLPPIGAGRPFVDIVHRLAPENVESEFPRIARGYAELTVPRRQTKLGQGLTNRAQLRADLMLAEWFSGRSPSPGADLIWEQLAAGRVDDTLRVIRWYAAEDLEQKLLDVLVDDLELDSAGDVLSFEQACGGREYEGRAYFWAKGKNGPGAAESAERWQILSPVRARAHGVRALNRTLQRRFREETRDRAKSAARSIPRPAGPEEILWGDKVISAVNESWRKVFPPEGAERYVANGDIGVVVGQYKTKNVKGNPWKLEVEFSSQPGFKYDYRYGDFGVESSPPLELAYALTVHRAQGSEFDRTIVVIPDPCRLLSRELLYTAVTRQRDRVTILYQGDPGELKRYAEPELSETAGRLTNLFFDPEPLERPSGAFLENGLLHTTTRGDVVRSKSEVIVAELFISRGIEYAYERKLTFADGTYRYPDFTIEDDDTGRTVYWEHLGMLGDSVYAGRWEKKREWYAGHGVLEASAGHPNGGPAGLLVWSADDERGGIDVPAIAARMDQLSG